jgi:hypothetical protein
VHQRRHRVSAPVPEAAPLQADLLHRMQAGARIDDAEFNSLALAVFRYQFAHNTPYRAYCRSRDATPEVVEHWSAIPAVPTAAFRAVPLLCGDPAEVQAVFRTSGTTAGTGSRGEHYVPDLTLYHAALRAGFAAHLLPDGARLPILSLVPPLEELPDSSLSHMVAEVMREYAAPESGFFIGAGAIDAAGLATALRVAEGSGQAVCLLGTSFALVHLLDALRERGERFSLPDGSRLMDTGGFKGRAREVTREELYDEVAHRLGIPPAWCVNEYGMTEMGSQFYDTVAGVPTGAERARRLHRGPAWVRSRAVDPETLELLPEGEPGILRHWDLANLHSVLALQTEDLGICSDAGFRLLGRDSAAEPRGCSLAMDELLSAQRRSVETT